MKDCQEITSDIEKSKLAKISLGNKLAIRIHLMLCKTCRSFSKDSRIIDKLLSRKFRQQKNYKFSPEEINKLKDDLKSS